jgi:hypothetical protein
MPTKPIALPSGVAPLAKMRADLGIPISAKESEM